MESAWTNRKHSKSQNDTAAGNNAPGSKLVQLQRQQSAAPATSSISSTSTTPTPSKISLSVRGKTTGSSSSPSNKSQRSTATNGLGSKKPVSSSSSSPSPQSSSLSSTPNPLASSSSVTTSQSGGGVGVGTGSETGSGSKIAATALPPVAAVSTDIHPLHYNWVFWFMHRNPGSKIVDYESAMMKVATFGSVEDFWAVYSHLKRPHELPNMSDYHMFKQGVRPVWEDEMNIKGGKWIVRLKKGLSSRYWENLIMAVIGDQFEVGSDICGIVLSIRGGEDILSIWNQSAHEGRTNLKIRDTLKRILELPSETIMEYKTHNDALKDKTSFRNTDVFR